MVCETVRDNKNHILHSVLKDSSFSFLPQLKLPLQVILKGKNIPENRKKEIAQKIHEKADDRSDNHDRYYAILSHGWR